ncbi:DUF3789 domain-containing protein [Ruminococcus flavefaciens]|nr:DUF3789 domain-containing protein [Ruminococcus flavefaciens]
MFGFVLGSMFGGTVGVVTMCLCTAAKWGDQHIHRQ